MPGQFFHKPTPDQSDRVPPGQHLASGFPVLTYGDTPELTAEQWQLQIFGLGQTHTLTWADFLALPQQTFTADFHCVTRWSKLDVQWQGVAIPEIFAPFEIPATITHVMQHCTGGYTTNVPLADFLRAENFFAHRLGDEPLPPDHGGPVRTVIPHLYAWKSAKWICAIEFLEQEAFGFWEKNGYHRRGEPWAEERYSG